METKGIAISMPMVVGIIVVVAVVAAAALLLSGGGEGTPITPPDDALMFDDFNDTILNSNFPNTSAGMMSEGGAYDPTHEFVSVGEGYALKLTYDLPQAKWCGYWSFMVSGDISTDPILASIGSGYDASSRSELRMAMRADGSNTQFKVELQDTLQFSDSAKAKIVFTQSSSTPAQSEYGYTPAQISQELLNVATENIDSLSNSEISILTQSHNRSVNRTVGTTWEEVVISLSEFESSTSPGLYGLHLSDLRQLNIVLEGGTTGSSGALYIDWIAFT